MAWILCVSQTLFAAGILAADPDAGPAFSLPPVTPSWQETNRNEPERDAIHWTSESRTRIDLAAYQGGAPVAPTFAPQFIPMSIGPSAASDGFSIAFGFDFLQPSWSNDSFRQLLPGTTAALFPGLNLDSEVDHELGHRAGWDHDDAGFMSDRLNPGERSLPQPADTDDQFAAFAGLDELLGLS